MKRYYLSGTVHPERAQISIADIENELLGQDDTPYAKLKFNIYNNQITAVIDCHNDNEDIHTIRNRVKAAVQIMTDTVGFIKGHAYDVEITKIFDEQAQFVWVYGVSIPIIEERNKGRQFSEAFEVYPLCSGMDGLYLRRCLGDINMAIKHADDTAFYCFRAIESLKQYIAFKQNLEGKDRSKWQALVNAIGGKEEDLDNLKCLAFPARHGIPRSISDTERKELFLTTWDIVERFIDYRLKESGSTYRMRKTNEA
ncbi:MAG: hypothetical protein HQ553_00860 [Chloroflexi bacterium]|nr:hypothetical protein [Chloroflexota bacterium]